MTVRVRLRAASCAAALALCIALPAVPASAAVWSWGCAGTSGDDQIIFNRERLVVIRGKPSLGNLDDIVQGGNSAFHALGKRTGVTIIMGYQPDDGNGGLDKRMSFTAEGDNKTKLVLSEQFSKKTGNTAKLLFGCRDETKERFTKIYRLEIGSEAPRTITLACLDYNLSTKGGRTCR